MARDSVGASPLTHVERSGLEVAVLLDALEDHGVPQDLPDDFKARGPIRSCACVAVCKAV
jgi:hypothetical protein